VDKDPNKKDDPKLHDTSKRATSIARQVDRLDPGSYLIILEKSNDGMTWMIDISRMMPVAKKRMPKI